MKLILAMCISKVAQVSPFRNRYGSMIYMAAWIGCKYESCGSDFINHKTFRGGRTESCFLLSQIFNFKGRNYTNSVDCSFQNSNCSHLNYQWAYITSFHEPGWLISLLYIYKGWHKKREFWKTQQKLKSNKKNLFTAIEPLQLAF